MKMVTPQLIGTITSLVLPCIPVLVSLSVITAPALAQDVSIKTLRAEADRLFQEGIELRQRERYDVALEKFQAALSIYEEINDRKGQADILNQLGNIYLSLNQHDQASDFYQRALALHQDRELANGTSGSPSQAPESITFQPADISFPGNRTSPATRSALLIESPIALMPETNYGQTTKPYPTLFIYLPEAGRSNQNLEISFHLIDEQDELRYTATRTYPETGGILGIRFEELENMSPLEENQQYQWYVEITGNSNSTLSLSGWIQRVEPISPEVSSTEIPLEAQSYYAAQTEAWYDALAALFELKQLNHPGNSRIAVDLRELLTSVGLGDVNIANFTGYWSGTPHTPENEPLATETNETRSGGFRPPPDLSIPPSERSGGGSR